MFRGTLWPFGLVFVMLAASLLCYGLNAPIAGALFLVAMVACAVAGFVLVAGRSNRVRMATRAAQRGRAQERAPWQD